MPPPFLPGYVPALSLNDNSFDGAEEMWGGSYRNVEFISCHPGRLVPGGRRLETHYARAIRTISANMAFGEYVSSTYNVKARGVLHIRRFLRTKPDESNTACAFAFGVIDLQFLVFTVQSRGASPRGAYQWIFAAVFTATRSP